MADVLSLKDAGNALYASRTTFKPTRNIRLQLSLTVRMRSFFYNRAACGMALNRTLEAISDAQMAVDLDPKYAKAWSRLAKCQEDSANYSVAISSWKHALECIPTTNLNSSEEKLRRQIEQGLKTTESRVKAAQLAAQAMHRAIPQDVFKSGDLPWDRAKAMVPEVYDRPTEAGISSACIILRANKTIEKLSDGVLTDKRIFRISDPSWSEKYNTQIIAEGASREAWPGEGPERVIELAQIRVREKGWDNTRPALSLTIRLWVMNGFTAYRVMHDYPAAVTWFNNVLELLERGRTIWNDVPSEDRGAVFTDNFVRSVRSFHLEAYLDACGSELGKFVRKYPLKRLFELADELYLDSSKPPPPETDRASILAFFRYPAANALA
ncbi:hypothetical protein BD410DRAFT_845061 [Rickenella mellea]|uniref:Uncharacterized protein n=1 Tax=Rickenella mellea TaxID=50990 RepID=A0A4Y7PKG4_9AGAM|nr:hypothetical protein BD410DRAFT_845061 [Rickenella mellea]